MTRYPDATERYVYYCEECGTEIPAFQGVFWFTREQDTEDGSVEAPYCPDCGRESIRSVRD